MLMVVSKLMVTTVLAQAQTDQMGVWFQQGSEES